MTEHMHYCAIDEIGACSCSASDRKLIAAYKTIVNLRVVIASVEALRQEYTATLNDGEGDETLADVVNDLTAALAREAKS